MKKCVSLILAGIMLMLCAAGLAENAVSTQIVSEGKTFNVTFELPEGAKVLSSGWEEGNLFQAHIRVKDGEYLYMAVDGSGAGAEGEAPTYNEANGYTDEDILSMIDDLYGEEYSSYDKQVVTTAYGTKIAVVRVNDEVAPMAYAWSRWNNFEIGITLVNINAEGEFLKVSDEQIANMTAFASEVWMHMNISEAGEEQEPEEEMTPRAQEFQAVSDWLEETIDSGNAAEALDWDLETVRAKLEPYEGELKYYTKDELAEEIYQQLVIMKEFMSAIEDLDSTDLTGPEE